MVRSQHASSDEGNTTPLACAYGLLDPLDWDQDCHEQLFLMNRFWNSLVEIERNYRERFRALICSDERIAPVEASLDTLRLERQAVRAARNLERQRARRRVATPEHDARLRDLDTSIHALYADSKPMRTEAVARLREPIRLLEAERTHSVKIARQQSGLWWGNYNAVCASYNVARIRAMKEGGELRFRRFTGEGRFAVQLVRGASVEEITGGKKQVCIDLTEQPVPGRAGKHRPRLAITIYTRDREPRRLTFPLIYDRALCADGRIKQVTVTRRRIGTKWRYAAILTLQLPRITKVATAVRTSACGINLGFRQTPTGLRIATVFDGAAIVTHELPARWMDAMDDLETIQRRRDKALNEMSSVLRNSWPYRPDSIPEQLADRIRRLIIAPQCAASTLATLALYWRKEHARVWPDALARLEEWRVANKRNLEIQDNKRDHLAKSRRERYRLLARSFASSFTRIRIGKIDLRSLARLERLDGTETTLHQRARRNRARAALHSLQEEIKQQASKFGAIVECVQGSVTATCHSCGGGCVVTSNLVHACKHCASVWDQDANAARNIFAAPGNRLDDRRTYKPSVPGCS